MGAVRVGVYSAAQSGPARACYAATGHSLMGRILHRARVGVKPISRTIHYRTHGTRRRACLVYTRDGETKAGRWTHSGRAVFPTEPRSMCAAILASMEIPPAPLRPPRRTVE